MLASVFLMGVSVKAMNDAFGSADQSIKSYWLRCASSVMAMIQPCQNCVKNLMESVASVNCPDNSGLSVK